MKRHFKVVLFDIDNTLLDFNECARQSVKYACDKTGLTFEERFMSAFFTINNFLWEQVENQTLTVERLHQIRFKTIFSALDIKADGAEFESLFRQNMRIAAVPIDGAFELLNHLKGKYFLAVASNSSYEQQKNRLKTAGMEKFFDEFFVSEKLKASKPDKAFFDAIMKELPTQNKDEILFIGDSLSADMSGGIDYKIKTCWFNPGGKTTDLPVDYTVTSLCEIKTILP